MKRRIGALLAGLLFTGAALADSVTVFADAGFKEALEAAAKAFQDATGHQVAITPGNAAALARHIESGAPADLLIAADPEALDTLEARQLLVPGSRKPVAVSDLVLIAPVTAAAGVSLAPGVDLAPLIGDKRIVMPHPDKTATGRAAKAALSALGAWDAIVRKVGVAARARDVVTVVARGNAPLGVVPRSEAIADKRVRVVDAFPAGSHPPVGFTMAMVARMSPPVAFEFADFLASHKARAAFEAFGLRAP